MLDIAFLQAALLAFLAFVALIHAAAVALVVRRHADHLGQRTGRNAEAELLAFEASRPPVAGRAEWRRVRRLGDARG